MLNKLTPRSLVAAACVIVATLMPSNGFAQSYNSHVYTQTNAVENEVIHFGRGADGRLTEIQRLSTGGKGSGEFKPVTGQESAPNPFEGAGSVILSADHKLLFASNGGNNSVAVFAVGQEGGLKRLDTQPTGQPVKGRSGTAKSLAFDDARSILYVLHTFGPDHLHLLDLKNGKLKARGNMHTVNTADKTDRLPTQVVLSPDRKFLLVDMLFDKRPGKKADGSPDLAVANEKDKDGLVVFPIDDDGNPEKPIFNDAGGKAAFYLQFLPGDKGQFLNGYAASDGIAVSTLDSSGKVTSSPVVAIDASAGKPSELCWLAVSGDGKFVFSSNFGLSSVSSFALDGDKLTLVKDPAAQETGNGTFASLNMLPTSAPSDSWASPDGRHFYQLYPNASKIVAYAIDKDGGLTKIGESKVTYQSSQGMAGF